MKDKKKVITLLPETHEFKFPMGAKLRDVVTGFEGVVTHRVQYLTGCDQYGLNPGIDKDGNLKDLRQFDENTLVVIGEPIVLPGNEKKEEPAAKPERGGPQPVALRQTH